MRIDPEISGVGIVVLGSFNPAIFTPAWFALHGLLPKSVADSADLKVAHQQITEFVYDWLHLQVMTGRFSVDTRQAPHTRPGDLVVRIFGEHLSHTPLSAFGINRRVHFRVRNAADRDRLGRLLAPTEPWGSWGRDLRLDDPHGGLKSLTITQLRPEGRPKGGEINITVEPSVRVEDGTGVYVQVNDHYAIDSSGPETGERLLELFEANFDASLKRSADIIDHIMSLAADPGD